MGFTGNETTKDPEQVTTEETAVVEEQPTTELPAPPEVVPGATTVDQHGDVLGL